MGILNDVMQYRARKEADREAQANAIPQALLAYQSAKQTQQDNLLKQLTVQATLAKAEVEWALFCFRRRRRTGHRLGRWGFRNRTW